MELKAQIRDMIKTNSILQESIDYISNNINAKTSEIPRCLLEYWYMPEDTTDFEQSSDLHSFFIFQYALETYCKTLEKEIESDTLKILGLFGQFQIIYGVLLLLRLL